MHDEPKPCVCQLPQLCLVPCRPIRQRMWQRAAGVVRLVLRRLPVGAILESGMHDNRRSLLYAMQLVLVHSWLLHGSGVLGGRGHGVRTVHGVWGGAIRAGGVRDLLGVPSGNLLGPALHRTFRQVHTDA